MELNTRHYRNYYEIKPGEGSRDIYGTFTDSPHKDKCVCTFTHPFKVDLGSNGRRNVGVAVRSFSVTNSPCNISHRNHTNVVYIDGEDTPVVMRPGFYETTSQIKAEINSALGNRTAVSFQTDHLGIVQYTGDNDLNVPYKVDGTVIPDNMATRLGYDAAKLYLEDGAIAQGRYECITIGNGMTGAGPGDMYGPCAECLIVCDECYYTPETDRVVSVTSLASNPPRAHIHCVPLLRFRPLQEAPAIPNLTLRLVDRSQRPLSFLSGVPCIIIELMHLD